VSDDASGAMPPRRNGSDIRWAFAVLAAIIVMLLVGWGWSGQGRGWGRGNEMAHMMPPVGAGMNGPASRAWVPPSNAR
jgi:hypothetical protein